MIIKFVVFDRSWQLEKSAEFTEDWSDTIPHSGDSIILNQPDEFGTVKRRIWQPDGSLILHVVREEKATADL